MQGNARLVEERLKALQQHAERTANHKRIRIALEARGRAQAYAKALQLVKGMR